MYTAVAWSQYRYILVLARGNLININGTGREGVNRLRVPFSYIQYIQYTCIGMVYVYDGHSASV